LRRRRSGCDTIAGRSNRLSRRWRGCDAVARRSNRLSRWGSGCDGIAGGAFRGLNTVQDRLENSLCAAGESAINKKLGINGTNWQGVGGSVLRRRRNKLRRRRGACDTFTGTNI